MNEISWGRKTRDAEHQQTLKRKVLLDTAARAFATKGYSETSIGELARQLDVSKPALYYYVKNKEDILLQCTEASLQLLISIFEKVNRSELNAMERLRVYFREYAQVVTGDYGYALIREGNKFLSPENRAKMRKIMSKGQEAAEQIIADGIEDGSIANCKPKYVAYLLFSTFNQMSFWFDPEGSMSEAEVADQMLDIVVSGIAPRD